MQQVFVSLDGRDHAGDNAGTIAERWSATEQANHLGLEARPRTSREFPQEPPVEACVESQAFGNGQHDLSVRDGRTDLFGNVDRGQQGPLLVAGTSWRQWRH